MKLCDINIYDHPLSYNILVVLHLQKRNLGH